MKMKNSFCCFSKKLKEGFFGVFYEKNLAFFAFFCSNHLEHRQAGLGECVKMTSGLDCISELATEYLHPQQGENENEQEEDNE